LRKEGKPDAALLEFFHDPQTSGGLLISVPAEKAEILVDMLKAKGQSMAAIIGEVVERGETAIVLRE
jgi:selenide,water dikinase